MAEQGTKERILINGETSVSDDRDIQTVRDRLRTHVRTDKGLPPEPLQLDVDLLSQLPSTNVVDGVAVDGDAAPKVVSIQARTHKDSALGLSAFNRRMASKKAA